jgi:hypothetical protein
MVLHVITLLDARRRYAWCHEYVRWLVTPPLWTVRIASDATPDLEGVKVSILHLAEPSRDSGEAAPLAALMGLAAAEKEAPSVPAISSTPIDGSSSTTILRRGQMGQIALAISPGESSSIRPRGLRLALWETAS